MELFRIVLRRRVSFTLLRDHMDQNSAVDPLGFVEQSRHLTDVMTVYRAQIRDAHILKKHPGDQYLLDGVLCP